MRRPAFATLAVVCSIAGSPTIASDLSAQDVLTYCLTSHAEPSFVRDRLIANGWTTVPKAKRELVTNSLAVGLLAFDLGYRKEGADNPEDWVESWNFAFPSASKLIGSDGKDGVSVLVDVESSAVIYISASTKIGIRIRCLLVVPERSARSQAYHPKLKAPPASKAFDVIVEDAKLSTSRARAASWSISVDPAVVKAALKIETDIVAVFNTTTTYPTDAVQP